MYCELVPGKATFLRLPPRRRSPQMHQQSTSNPIGKQKAKWSQVRVDERYMLMRLKSATGNTSSILLRVAYPKEITFFEVKVEVWPGLWHVCRLYTQSRLSHMIRIMSKSGVWRMHFPFPHTRAYLYNNLWQSILPLHIYNIPFGSHLIRTTANSIARCNVGARTE